MFEYAATVFKHLDLTETDNIIGGILKFVSRHVIL